MGCTHNKISVVLDAAGEGYNDGAAYVFDADGSTVERLGMVPKKKRVVLTDKELFEDDIWLASREKRDDDDEDFPEGCGVAATTKMSRRRVRKERQPWRDEFDREFERRSLLFQKRRKSWVWRVVAGPWRVLCASGLPLDYYDDDALREAMPKKT